MMLAKVEQGSVEEALVVGQQEGIKTKASEIVSSVDVRMLEFDGMLVC